MDVDATAQTTELSQSDADASTPRILCVDDEPDILASLRRLFKDSGYSVRIADSAANGLRILENESIDLVISDLHMPHVDGARFLGQVRERWPQTLRILLAGQADAALIAEAINRGEIVRYFTKPWDDDDMAAQVRLALERRKVGVGKGTAGADRPHAHR